MNFVVRSRGLVEVIKTTYTDYRPGQKPDL